MFIPGHLALGYLGAVLHARRLERPPRLRPEVLPAFVGALTPDLIDKPLLLLGVMSGGRTLGHSVFFLLFTVLLWAVIRRWKDRETAVPFALWSLGVATHSVADVLEDATRGFLEGGTLIRSWFAWPFLDRSDWAVPSPEALWPTSIAVTPVEILVVVLALGVAGGYGVRTRS